MYSRSGRRHIDSRSLPGFLLHFVDIVIKHSRCLLIQSLSPSPPAANAIVIAVEISGVAKRTRDRRNGSVGGQISRLS